MTNHFKHIVVYGATSAIAQDMCRALVSRGAECFSLIGRNKSRLEIISADLKAQGATSVSLTIEDLSQGADYTEHCTKFESTAPIDLVILAHGILSDDNNTPNDWRKQIELFNINTLNPITILTAWGNYFEQKKSGALAVITSVAGDRGRQSNYPYGASKAALIAYLQGLRNRLSRHNVYVADIRPGFIDTPMTAHISKKPFVVSSDIAGRFIVKQLHGKKDIIYAPQRWRFIMMIIKLIPETIFKRLSL
jgi:decaprenylphospho-beta-D-erythro-pentofuranosid-2-ulose 2-reductase